MPSLAITRSQPAQPRSLTGGSPNSQFLLRVNGDFGPDYSVQTSTNLDGWTTVFTTNSPQLPFTWIDTNYPVFPQKYYWIRIGP